MSFVLGGTGASSSNVAGLERQAGGSVQSASLVAGDQYIVSPRMAKLTFTTVTFRDASGNVLGASNFTGCTVTYDRSLASGSTLLDCPFTVPVGNIYQVQIALDNNVQLLVSEATPGIYSDPSSASGYSATAPAGGAGFVPFTVAVVGAAAGSQSSISIVFASPISVAAGSTPRLYITTDMIQTLQLAVNAGGATLSPVGFGAAPVAFFGGPTPGSSSFYSNANSIESYKVGTVQTGFYAIRIFYDQAGNPLYLFGGNTCGVNGPLAATATPPIGGNIGGWLGRDASRTLAWALPTDGSYTSYAAYFVMAEATAIGQSTVLKCKAMPSPPPPADGKTYASGAPAMASPDKTTTLTLLAK
jgi:hypothetical protein